MFEYRFASNSLWARAMRAPSDGGGAAPPVPPTPGTPPVAPPTPGTPPVAPPPTGPPAGGTPQLPWGNVQGSWQMEGKPWYEALPDGPTKELMRSKNYDNPTVVADSYYALNKQFNNADKLIEPLPENATPEQIDAFQKKLGRPETIDGYKEVPWGDNADPRMVEFGKNLAFKFGLSPKAAAEMAAEWNTFNGKLATEGTTEYQAANNKALADLETSWGAELEPNRAAGQRVLQSLEAKGFGAADMAAVEAHIGAAPLVKLLATIGKLAGGEGRVPGAGNTGAGGTEAGLNAAQAQAKIAELQSDATFMQAYGNNMHPGHKDAVERMLRLHSVT